MEECQVSEGSVVQALQSPQAAVWPDLEVGCSCPVSH